MSCCAHCGKQREGLKQCSVCKAASYCGPACQNASWKSHKKKCVPHVPLAEVFKAVNAAAAAGDAAEGLKWKGRMEEMLAGQSLSVSESILRSFMLFHQMQIGVCVQANDRRYHAADLVKIEERRVELLKRLQRFRDAADSMCYVASNYFYWLDNPQEAKRYCRTPPPLIACP